MLHVGQLRLTDWLTPRDLSNITSVLGSFTTLAVAIHESFIPHISSFISQPGGHQTSHAIVTYLINQATNQPTNQPIKHSAICSFINQTSTKVCYCASPDQSYIRQSIPVPHLIHHTLGNVVLELILRVDVSDRRHFKCVVSEINCIFVLQLTVRT